MKMRRYVTPTLVCTSDMVSESSNEPRSVPLKKWEKLMKMILYPMEHRIWGMMMMTSSSLMIQTRSMMSIFETIKINEEMKDYIFEKLWTLNSNIYIDFLFKFMDIIFNLAYYVILKWNFYIVCNLGYGAKIFKKISIIILIRLGPA